MKWLELNYTEGEILEEIKEFKQHEVLIRYWVNIDELKRLAYA